MDETDYSGLLDYLIDPTAFPPQGVPSQGLPTQQPVTTRLADGGEAPVSGLSAADPYADAMTAPATAAPATATPAASTPQYKWGVISNPNGDKELFTVRFVSDKRGELPLTVTNDTPIFLYDNKTKRVIAGGVGFQGADDVAAAVANMSGDKKSWWDIYTGPPGATDVSQFKSVIQDQKNTSFGERFLNAIGTGLPIAAAFIPGLGPLAQIAVGAGAGGAGAALKGQNILTGALTGGATAGIMNAPILSGGKSLGSAIGGALNEVPGVGDAFGAITSGVGSGGYQNALGDILVTGAPVGALGNALGAAGGGALANFINAPSIAPTMLSPSDIAKEVANNAAGRPNVVNGVDQATGEIVAQGTPAVAPNAGAAFGTAVTGGLLPNGVPETIGTSPIEVTGQKNNAGAALGATTGGALSNILDTPPPSTLSPSDIAKEVAKDTTTGQTDGGVSLSKLIDYLQAAGLGVGLIGDLLGGGSKPNTANRIPAGFGAGGGGSGVFGSELPAANLPGGTSTGARTAADLATRGLGSNLDYYRYGYGPEQSFMQNVPQGARNTSTAYTGYEQPFEGIEKLAEGGMPAQKRKSFAVSGPGDGRDDKIDALLSDGEYVMDAETVALLGNGSSKAGAEALDQFRVNVRKHKGQKLAAGRFSAKAKRPEQYLKKGRA